MGQDEKHVRFADQPEVRTYRPDPAEQNAEVVVNPNPAPEKHVRFADEPEVRTYQPDPAEYSAQVVANPDKHVPPDRPLPPIPPGRAPADAASPSPASEKKQDGPAMGEMPRDPVKLAAWLKENADKLPADERAMLDKALAGGKQIYAQGPPIQVDMSDVKSSSLGDAKAPSMFHGLGDRISQFASEMKDKIKSTFSRESKEDGPPRDPAKYAEWLQQNPQKLSPQEQALLGQAAHDGPPRDPAQYAEWLQKNSQELSPQERALAAHVQGAEPPGAAPGNIPPPGATPGSTPPSGGVGPGDAKSPADPHLAHPLYTNAQAHEVAKEIAHEHDRGHGLERGVSGPGH